MHYLKHIRYEPIFTINLRGSEYQTDTQEITSTYIHTIYTRNGKFGEPTEPTLVKVQRSKTEPKEK